MLREAHLIACQPQHKLMVVVESVHMMKLIVKLYLRSRKFWLVIPRFPKRTGVNVISGTV